MGLGTFVAIDFETSGPRGCDACAVGLVRVREGCIEDAWYRLIRPPSSYVQYTWVHGLTWSMLKDQPAFPELWPEMAGFLRGAQGLVAHNAPFDRSVLAGCCQAFGCANPGLPFYCTLKGSRRTFGLPSNKLDLVCAHLGIGLKHHEALSDATACAAIFIEILSRGTPLEAMLSGTGKAKRGA